MKKISMILILLLTLSTKTFANGDKGPFVILDLNLNIDKLCDPNIPFCKKRAYTTMGGIKVLLIPQDGELVCQDGLCERINIHHYRGLWSRVVERDGLRTIAIVSIDKHIIANGQEKEIISYIITGEIQGENGNEAKLSMNTNNLKNLNSVTLLSPIKYFHENKYQTLLKIGPAMRLFPLPRDVEEQAESQTFSPASVDLISGIIKVNH